MAGLTVNNPVMLTNALSSERIIPGDVLLLKAGTYTGDYVCSWQGTKANPIIIRPYGDGPVIIDGTFTLKDFVQVYDIDFTDTRPNRLWEYYGKGAAYGITVSGHGNHLHGCSIQQMRSDGVNWYDSELDNAGEISENVFLLNGDRFSDGSGHGHSLYSHNDAGGRRIIARNSMYLNLGAYTLQLYSADNHTDDYTIDSNIFMGPITPGGHFGPNNLVFQNNINYLYPVHIAYLMGGHTCNNILMDSNTFIDCSTFTVGGDPGVLTNLVETNNVVYGGQPSSRDGYAFTAKPATLVRITPFTKSARWLGMLSIYNRDSAATVVVDFSSLLTNGNYKLMNTQNLTETWNFTYSGAPINVPTNFTSGAFIGDDYVASTTWPVFGAFVVMAQ